MNLEDFKGYFDKSFRRDKVSGITPGDCLFLYNFIRTNKCLKVLEIGMADGMSSFAILSALQENSKLLNNSEFNLTSIDPFQELTWNSNGVNNLKEKGFDKNHTLLKTYNYLALPKLIEEGKKYDLIFIDGMHTFDHVLLDNFYSDYLLNINGHIINDDFHMPSVKNALSYIKNNYCHLVISNDSNRRFGPIFKKIKEKNIQWNSFNTF